MGEKSAYVFLEIKGRPVPKGRPRFGNGHTYTPAATKAHEQLIQAEYLVSGGRRLTGLIEAEFEFIYEPPKSWSKKKRMGAMGMPKETKPDLDNLIKCCEDALNGLAYTDDSRIWKTTAQKTYGPEEKTIIKLREADVEGQ